MKEDIRSVADLDEFDKSDYNSCSAIMSSCENTHGKTLRN